MKETRTCPNCKIRMIQNAHKEKGQNFYIYLKCKQCGFKRKIQISEKIIENYSPIVPDTALAGMKKA